MGGAPQVLRSVVDGLPITSVFQRLTLAPDLVLVKSGVVLNTARGEQYFFSGDGVDGQESHALDLSIGEILERVFAHPAIHERTETPRSYPLVRFLGEEVLGSVDGERVLLTGKHPMSRSMEVAEALDHVGQRTNGLGFHPRRELAVEHAVLELLERHLACQLWYLPEGMALPLGPPRDLGGGYFLDRYTVAREPLMPFVCSVLRHRERSVFVTGTALRPAMADAVVKADQEALSTIENDFGETNGLASNPVTAARFRASFGELAVRRAAYLAARTACTRDVAANAVRLSVDEIVVRTLFRPRDLHYSILWRCTAGWVVRALADEALDKRRLRRWYSGSDTPSDPYG